MLRFGVGDTDMNRTKGTCCKAHVYSDVSVSTFATSFPGESGDSSRVDDLELNVKEQGVCWVQFGDRVKAFLAEGLVSEKEKRSKTDRDMLKLSAENLESKKAEIMGRGSEKGTGNDEVR